MKTISSVLGASLVLAFGSNAYAQSSSNATAQQSMSQSHAQQSGQQKNCDRLQGNAKDVCEAERKGAQNVAKVQSKLGQNNTPKARMELAEAKADAKYDADKARCDAQVGDAKDACADVAKAERELTVAKAKQQSLSQASSTGNSSGDSGSAGTSSSGESSMSTPPSSAAIGQDQSESSNQAVQQPATPASDQ